MEPLFFIDVIDWNEQDYIDGCTVKEVAIYPYRFNSHEAARRMEECKRFIAVWDATP